MLANSIVVLVAIAAAVLLFSRKLQTSVAWQATVTPLASIIGSGFLVSVPLLADEVGNWAVFAMAGLVGAAYLVGEAIRFNIRHAEPMFDGSAPDKEPRLAESLEKFSHIVLTLAYFISVAYYLVLLSNFLLHGFGIKDADLARAITTAILAGLGGLGFFKGLGSVERVEKYSVGVNLAVIAGLLGGLLLYNGQSFLTGGWHLGQAGKPFTLHSAQVLLGLLIVVQGFETSRFMGDTYDADTRIRTMRYAQWISTVIYMLFFLLMTVLFPFLGKDRGITAIIDLVGHVALFLPAMLTVSAIASQFSASVADSVGCTGLIENITNRRVSLRHLYPLIALVAIGVTWNADVFRIITLASQAFGLFYLLQTCVALAVAHEMRNLANRSANMALFAAVAFFCLCVVLFGIPSGA